MLLNRRKCGSSLMSKILLDENLPRQLKRDFAEHEVFTVRDMRWNGQKNGALLRLAIEEGFSVFITNDRAIPKQNNVATMNIAIFIFSTKNNEYTTLQPLTSFTIAALEQVEPGTVTFVDPPEETPIATENP